MLSGGATLKRTVPMQRRLSPPGQCQPAAVSPRSVSEQWPSSASRGHARRKRRRAPAGPAAVALFAALAAPAAALGAQTQVALTAHASRSFALPNAPYLYGASLATYTGIVGVRVGGGIGDVRRIHRANGDVTPELGAWTADADLLLAPGQSRAFRAALGGLGPYGFVGIGTQGVRRAALAARESGPVWSYGAGLAQPLLGSLYLEGEGRFRRPIVNDGVRPPPGFARAWEYRLGLAIRFGGRRGGGGEWDRAGEP